MLDFNHPATKFAIKYFRNTIIPYLIFVVIMFLLKDWLHWIDTTAFRVVIFFSVFGWLFYYLYVLSVIFDHADNEKPKG